MSVRRSPGRCSSAAKCARFCQTFPGGLDWGWFTRMVAQSWPEGIPIWPEWWWLWMIIRYYGHMADDPYTWFFKHMIFTWLSYYKTPSRVLPMDNDRCRLVLMVGPAGSSQGTDPDRATAVVRWCLWCSEPLSFGAKMGHRSVVCSWPLANFKGAL